MIREYIPVLLQALVAAGFAVGALIMSVLLGKSGVRTRTKDSLWGFCATCPFAEPCMGGCTFTAHAIMGRPGNNPYCSYRARAMAAKGQRERLVPAARAPGEPFDNGRFEIVIEPLDAPDERPERPTDLVKLRRASH